MKKVIILGASRYYSMSIESAKNAGYYIIALDRNPESAGFAVANEGVTCDISDKDSVLKVAIEKKIDAIVPLNDVGVFTAAYVAEKLNLSGISQQVALLSVNKEMMRNKWIETGIPCPKVFTATTREEFDKGIKYVGYPCIFKPAHGAGGASRGVIAVNNETEVEAAIVFSQKFYDDKATLIETFIEAEYEHSAEVLIYKGKAEVIAISDKIKTPLPYRVDKNVLYPTKVSGQRLQNLKKTIVDSVLALGINNGAAHVELATTKNGFVLFELGARCGGGGTPEPIVHTSTGVNEFVELVRILAGDEPHNLIPTQNLGCNYHFLAPKPGKIKNVKGIEKINNLKGVLDFELFKKIGDEILPVTVGTERSGFIITTGKNADEAYEIGCKAEALIEIEYED
jgi:carbamoyl-phosphate synthase large subunit